MSAEKWATQFDETMEEIVEELYNAFYGATQVHIYDQDDLDETQQAIMDGLIQELTTVRAHLELAGFTLGEYRKAKGKQHD